ncbi:MAG TPA: ThiF family adenylyltransferase, partial [Polyangia bacterium]|nr:ThiF family adenylyltransferase [Polyangia bacterium]
MDAAAATRFARQLALPEVGPAGQERVARARALIVGDGVAAEIVARYLAAAGVGTLRLVGGETGAWTSALRGSNPDVIVERQARPADGAAWVKALEGVSIVVRADFDDDALMPAAIRRGVPLVVLRGQTDADVVDVVSFRKHGPCP